MGIKINWTDFNTTPPASFNIYRSTSRIDVTNPPAALATVAGNVHTYEDTTALRNTLYYYVVSAFDAAGDETFSENMPSGYYPYTGPGPQTLVRGNLEMGVFGEMDADALFLPADLKTLTGHSGTAATIFSKWIKAAYKGKIVFFANYPSGSLKFDDVYAAGMAYSGIPQEEWPSLATVGRALVPQNKVIWKGEDSFYVRLPSSRKNRNSTSTVAADLLGGEYDALIVACLRQKTAGVTPVQWNDALLPANAGDCLSGDFFSTASSVIVRNIYPTGYAVNDATVNARNTTELMNWWPLLELVL